MTSLQDKNNLEKIYLAAFLRAPELEGLNYWLSEVDSKGLAQTLKTIFSLPTVQQIYATNQSNDAFVTAIYNNVFNRAPDAEGLKYWTTQHNWDGNRGQLVLDMINAGLGTPDGTAGKAAIVNRYEHAKSAVALQESYGVSLDPAYLANQYKSITSDASSVSQVSSLLAALVKSLAPAYDPLHDRANASLLNDGVIDLFPSQPLGTAGQLSASQTEFLADVFVARLFGLTDGNDTALVEPDSKGGYLFHVTLKGHSMSPLRVHIGSQQMDQVNKYEASSLLPVAVDIVSKSLTEADLAILNKIVSGEIDANNVPADFAARAEQGALSAHNYFSDIALVGYQKAAAGTLDGWITM